MSAEEPKGFTVTDKRQFTAEGEVRESEPEKEKPAEQPKTEARTEKKPEAAPPPLPEMNFSTFIFSLFSSALLHLGAAADPNTGQTEVNLPLARQTIDALGMLKDKTRGNLDEEEGRLLDHLLYELRMLYVKQASQTKLA